MVGAIHSSGDRGACFDAETAVTWKFNFRHPPYVPDLALFLPRALLGIG